MYGKVLGLHHSQLPGVQTLVNFVFCHGYVLTGLERERERHTHRDATPATNIAMNPEVAGAALRAGKKRHRALP